MNEQEQPVDTGLLSFVLLLRFLGVAADPKQIEHQLGGAPCGTTEILRCAKQLELKARIIESDWERLGKTSLPAIAEDKEGGFFILGRLTEDGALIQDPRTGRPQNLKKEELQERWTGQLILI